MIYLAAAIVIVTLAVMASGRVPPVVALGAGLAVAGITGVATFEELSAGLSNGGVITVAGMLVIAKGIVQTGLVTRIAWRLLATVTSGQQALRRLLLPIGITSSLINTTPIVAMLVPATRELERTRRVPARSVLLPIAHVTTLFGSITLIGTSSNLLIAGIADSFGVEMGMFSFAPVALPVALVGTLAVYLLAPRLLGGETLDDQAPPRGWRVEIPVAPHALTVGRLAAGMGIAATQAYELQAIARGNETHPPNERIKAGDLLIFRATEEGVTALWKSPLFGLSPHRLYAISIGSGEAGTLHDMERTGTIRVVAAQTELPLSQTPLTPGDICFVTGESADVLQENGAIALWRDAASRSPQPEKSWIALLILAGVIVSATLGLLPVALAAVSGALLMVLTRVISPGSASRALDWNVLFILAGSVGLGSIVVSSGLADEIAGAIRRLSAGSELGVVIVFVVTTAIITNLITNAAAASMLTPVAIGLAAELGIDPITLLALIGTCISFTFINPYSHQSNLMVMRPGGYTNVAFARFGVPLVAISVATACAVAYLLVIGG